MKTPRPGELPLIAVAEGTVGLHAHQAAQGRPGAMRLAPVSFAVSVGDLLVVVGRNGAGKSTLLRLAAGHERPSSGGVAWHGPGPPRVASHLGQDQLFPQLTVGEHFALLADCWPSMDPGAPAALLLAWDMGGLHEAFPDELSSGQKQGVHLACTLTRPSDLLLLDEPERHLDVQVQADLVARLADAAAAGRAVVVATHSELLRSGVGEDSLLELHRIQGAV